MATPGDQFATTCDIYRPFGSGSPTYTNVACRLVPDLARGSGTTAAGIAWTHYLLVDIDTDIKDGCTRTPGTPNISFADGDEIHIPTGEPRSSWVVVWVEIVDMGTAWEHKRAYLTRDVV